jgi:hypothetical protein
MWEPQHLTTLRTSTASYGDTFSFYSDGRRATGWTALVGLPAGVIELSVVHSDQTGSGAQPASYPVGTGVSFPEGEAACSRMVELLSTGIILYLLPIQSVVEHGGTDL